MVSHVLVDLASSLEHQELRTKTIEDCGETVYGLVEAIGLMVHESQVVVTGYVGVLDLKGLFEHFNCIFILFLFHVRQTFAVPEFRVVFADFNSSIEVFLSLLILSHGEESVTSIEEEVRIRGLDLFLIKLDCFVEVVQRIVVSFCMEEYKASIIVIKGLLWLEVDCFGEFVKGFFVVTLIEVRPPQVSVRLVLVRILLTSLLKVCDGLVKLANLPVTHSSSEVGLSLAEFTLNFSMSVLIKF